MATSFTSRPPASPYPEAQRVSSFAADRQRRELARLITQSQESRYAWIRHQVLVRRRLDILAHEVLHYDVADHHLAMLQHVLRHPHETSIILGFRGCGKTTTVTVVYIIFLLLTDPDITILLASKSGENAIAMLSEIKAHLEANADFIACFGSLLGKVWNENEINVSTRKHFTKNCNVKTIGIEGAVTSQHYDVIICDDLVDEQNSHTPIMRQKTFTFYYKTLTPCLGPSTYNQAIIMGTRYHYRDLYGHLMGGEAKGRTLVIPALLGNEVEGWRSAWPEKFPVERLLSLRSSERMGTILFDTQFQLDCRKMQGRIFDYDDCTVVADNEIPDSLPRYGGTDLAISEKKRADLFANVVIAYDHSRDFVYVVDFLTGQFTQPARQRALIKEMYRRHNCVKWGIEANAYQASSVAELREEDKTLSLVKIFTAEDKITRAWKLSPRFESRRIAFRKGLEALIEQVVLFPDGDHDDGFDALDLAIRTPRAKEKKPREEPRLI